MEDNVVNQLIESKLWTLKPYRNFEPINLFHIHSNMKGFSNGRYRLEITKLGRKVDSHIYKVSMYWTPYDPYNLVFFGRFNTYEELIEIIGKVNKDLLDTSRAYS